MKKLLSLTLAALLLLATVFAFASCGDGPQTVFKPEPKGTLKLGFDSGFPPYGYLDAESNEYAGFDIELAKAVCADLGYVLELVPIDWNAKDAELASGTINCIWNGFTINAERLEKYSWTPAYADNSIVVLVKGSSITDLAGLAGKSVVVQAGSSGEDALKEKTDLVASFNGGAYSTITDYVSAFTEPETGAVDAIVVDKGVAESLIKGKSGYSILAEAISTEQYGIAFAKTDAGAALRDVIWCAIEAMDKAEIGAIAEKYGIKDAIIID
jgi:polar amino acid transport system substrate-binding protein